MVIEVRRNNRLLLLITSILIETMAFVFFALQLTYIIGFAYVLDLTFYSVGSVLLVLFVVLQILQLRTELRRNQEIV